MASFTVQNDAGQSFQVNDENLADAAKDGFHPVVSNGTDQQRVPVENLHEAMKDGFAPISEGPRSPFLSAVDKYLAGASAGFAPKIAGGLEAAGRAAGVQGASGPLNQISLAQGGPTLDPDTLSKSYAQGRDQVKQDLLKDSIDNPAISKTAEVAGMLTSPVNKLASGVSLAKGGAILGGINAAGSSDADSVGDYAKDVATGAGVGLVGGAALNKVGQALSPIVQKGASAVGSKFNDMAEAQAFKGAGAIFKDYKKVGGEADANELGRFMLDNKVIQAGDTVKDVAAKSAELNKNTGNALSAVYSDAKSGIANASPETKSAIDAAGFNPVRDKDAIMSAAKGNIGQDVDKKAALNKLSNYLDDLAEEHGDVTLDPKIANDIKGALDSKVRYSRAVGQVDPAAEKAFYAARKEVAQKINDHISAIGEASGNPDAAEALKAANSTYGQSKTIADLAKERVSRDAGKQTVGLTEMLGGIAGVGELAHYGGIPGALAGVGGIVGAKVAQKYGTGVSAGMFNKAGAALSETPAIQAIAQGKQGAIQSIIHQLTPRIENAGTNLMQKAAGQPTQDNSSPSAKQAPTKGPDKWAGDGFENLLQHSDDAKSLDQSALMQDPKTKQLLIAASDLKPGSKAMDNILGKIQDLAKGQK